MVLAAQALASMRMATERQEEQDVLALAINARRDNPDDHRSFIDIGNLLRDKGRLLEAQDFYHHVLSRNAIDGFALFELASLEAMNGRHSEALLYLERLLAHQPSDTRSLSFAARMSARIGDRKRAFTYASRFDEATSDGFVAAWLRELTDFMDVFPAGVADYLAHKFERNASYVSADVIAGWAEAALVNKHGFSLIRLGDGEGAFCKISQEDERRYSNIYQHCRKDRSDVWFKGEIDIRDSGFTDVAFSLRDAVAEANVVGVPYRTWVSHEHKYCSPTGVVCLTNALRLCGLPGVDRGQSWTTQLVHMDFLQRGLLEQLLRRYRRVNLISCLSDAADALKSIFNLDQVTMYRVPGEKAHAEQLGECAVIGQHFPTRYAELNAELDRHLAGELFLVAGGLLGKLYCARIKRSGGVALDIGSVVDIWMGKATRPGADHRYKLKS